MTINFSFGSNTRSLFYDSATFCDLYSTFWAHVHYFWGLGVLAIEDDLIQFWCGNMVTLDAMILCIGYLAYGMDFE